MAYVKLSTSILDSSVWEQDPEVRITWITLLAMADQDGHVRSTAGGIARNAIIPLEIVKRALATFEAPDPDSRTPDHDGRRIAKVPGGWDVLNYEKYRDENNADERKEKQRARQARYRGRQKAQREAHATALKTAGVEVVEAGETTETETSSDGKPCIMCEHLGRQSEPRRCLQHGGSIPKRHEGRNDAAGSAAEPDDQADFSLDNE